MRRLLLLGSIALLPSVAHANALSATVFGEVIDVSNHGAPIADAIVMVTSKALQGEQTAITDAKGRYRIDQLPPGDYLIKVSAPTFKDYEAAGVRLLVSREVKVRVEMLPEVMTGSTIEVTKVITSSIDQGSTATGLTLTKDYLDRVATARTFESVTTATPGAQADEYGVSFGGTTSPENAFFVDGMNVQGISDGTLQLRLPTEFFDQIEVKVGGYMPEFGQATGGYVNTVSKQGGSEVHGSVFSYTTPLRLPAHPIKRVGETITGSAGLGISQELGFEVGGPIAKDLLWFHVGLSPQFQHDVITKRLRKNGSEELPEYERSFGRFSHAYRYTAKLTLAPSEDHRLSITAQGNPTFEGGSAVGGIASDLAGSFNGDESAFSYGTREGVYKATLNYDGKFLNKKLLVDAVVGYMQEDHMDIPYSDAPQITWNPRVSLTRFEPNLIGECGVSGCIVQGYRTGGMGYHEFKRGERFTTRVNVAGLFQFLGSHNLKGGLEYMRASLYNRRGFTGGVHHEVIDDPNLGRIYRDDRRFARPVDENDPNNFALRNLDPWINHAYYDNYSAYLQDSWSILDRVNLNGGIRMDYQDMYGGGPRGADGNYVGGNVSTLRMSNWSPRIGAIWDFLGNGRTKLFASWSRTYELVPLGLWNRSTPTEVETINDRELCNAPVPSDCRPLRRVQVYGAEETLVLQKTGGQFVDRLELGFEYQITQDLMVGIDYTNSRFGDVIEDFSTDDGSQFFVGNPGVDRPDVKGINPLDPANPVDINYQAVDAVTGRMKTVKFPKPERKYDAVNIYLTKSLANNWIIQASYTASFLRGHYGGLFRAEDGQLDANLSTELDLVSTLPNRYGPLPADRTHQFKLDTAYIWSVSERFAVVPNLVMRVGSGTPFSYTGPWPGYGAQQSYLITRGTAGHTEPMFQADAGIKGEYVFSKSSRLTVGLTFINVGSVQLSTQRDDRFVRDDQYVRPIAGGDVSDLSFVKTFEGRPALLNPNFGNVTHRQTPMEVRIDAKLTF